MMEFDFRCCFIVISRAIYLFYHFRHLPFIDAQQRSAAAITPLYVVTRHAMAILYFAIFHAMPPFHFLLR